MTMAKPTAKEPVPSSILRIAFRRGFLRGQELTSSFCYTKLDASQRVLTCAFTSIQENPSLQTLTNGPPSEVLKYSSAKKFVGANFRAISIKFLRGSSFRLASSIYA